MGVYDIYKIPDWMEYTQQDMLYALVEQIRTKLEPAVKDLRGAISGPLNKVGNFIENLRNDLSTGLYALIDKLNSAFDRAVDALTGPIREGLNTIGSYVETIWNGVKNLVTGMTEVISTEIESIWGRVKGFLSESMFWLWDKFKNISVTVYDAIRKAIDWCWDKFVKVVIPFIYQMLVRVYESPEVQKVIVFVADQLEALFAWLFDIDTAEMEKWAKKTVEFVRSLVKEEAII